MDKRSAPVRAVVATITLSFGVEGTYMRTVAFVIGFGPRQLLEHLPTCRRRPALVQLVLASGELNDRGLGQFDQEKKKEGRGVVVIRYAPWLPDSARSTPG